MSRVVNQLFRLEPMDNLFFRGGRPFGPIRRVDSGLPKPQTVTGALRTALLKRAGISPANVGSKIRAGDTFAGAVASFGELGAAVGKVRIRGPWLGREASLVYPVPANLREVKGTGRLVRLDPLSGKLPGWSPDRTSLSPLWWPGREKLNRKSGYVNAAGMSLYLSGQVPDCNDLLSSEELYGFDDRTGIELNSESRIVKKGSIYTARMLALRPNVYLYVEILGLSDVLQLFPPEGALIRLGGEGRRVAIFPENEVSAPRNCSPTSTSDGCLVVLTTAALAGGWCPQGLQPIAAAVPGYEPVSGWDLARGGPKPNRFAIPAGSVFFLREGDQIGTISAESDIGWGSFLTGNWKYTNQSALR